MGLFQRRQDRQTEVLYSISYGLEKTWLVIGLGNPGEEYGLTRHNVGFLTLDALAAAENSPWSMKKSLKSEIAVANIGSTRLILCKPQTFMNLSGTAVQAVQRFYKVSNANTIAVHDELDIPFGQIRTRTGGSAAGHNGIKSLMQYIGEDFGRVRIGIGPKTPGSMDSADFVLQKFSKTEQGNLTALKSEVAAVLNEAVFGGGLKPETRSFL